MTDDIVKYLRLSQTRFNRHAEAANEIERLRAKLKRWENCELIAESLCLLDDDESVCDTCKKINNG